MQLDEQKLRQILREHGAELIGFADLRGVEGADLPYGVSVAVPLPVEVVRSIADGPTLAYRDTYGRINARLNEIVTAGAEYLTSCGYQAIALTTDVVRSNENYCTPLPHKTAAVHSGLGWIGKCTMLVTRDYGSAVRLSTLVTDAPLTCDEPTRQSQCGGCMACTQACPAQAVRGTLWQPGMEREQLMDADACRKTVREITMRLLGQPLSICGKCIEVCPYTRDYLRREENKKAHG